MEEEKKDIFENEGLFLACDGEAGSAEEVTEPLKDALAFLTPSKPRFFAKLADWFAFSFVIGFVTASWMVLFYYALKCLGVFE